MIEDLNYRKKLLEEVLDKSEQTKQDAVTQMEKRVSERVDKILL